MYNIGSEQVPIVAYSATNLVVDGTTVAGSYCHIVIHSVTPFVIEGRLNALGEHYVLKALKSPAGDWEKTVAINEKNLPGYLSPNEAPHFCDADTVFQEDPLRETFFQEEKKIRGKRDVLNGTMHMFSIGLFMDCNFLAAHSDLSDAVADTMLAIAFANTKYGADFYLNVFVRPDK